MKKNLEDIVNALESEIETAKALSQVMILIHAGSYSIDTYEIKFAEIQNFFGLMSKISEKHANNLDILTDELIDFSNDLKNK